MLNTLSLLAFFVSHHAFSVMTGAKALQIENDKKSFFQCVVMGFEAKTRKPANIEIKKVSKYELKAKDKEGNPEGIYFDLWGVAGFRAHISNGELVLISEIDDEGEVRALAFKKAPAFTEMDFVISIKEGDKEKKDYEKFSLDCFKFEEEIRAEDKTKAALLY